VPDYPHHRVKYLPVLQSPGVTRFPRVDDELPRAAVAIRAGDMPLGTIWAIEGEDGLTPEGERALLDGVKVAALHMLREQDVGERERHLRGEVLRAMLAGTRSAEDGAERLGLTPGSRAVLVGFATVEPDPSGTVIARVGHAVSQYAAAYRPEVAIATTPDAVYAVVSGADDGVRRFSDGALASSSKATGTTVQAAMTRSTGDLDDLATLRAEVDAVLGAAMADERAPAVATVADVHTRLLLDRVGDQLARDPRLRHPEVQRMTEHDRDRGTDYGVTVLAWLEAFNDIGSAAARLQVHPNTLRYRLRRIEEKFGLDFTDPESRLSAWLQLRMVEARPPAQSST
jgi:DNA-binding PucR family transcriptional regulator